MWLCPGQVCMVWEVKMFDGFQTAAIFNFSMSIKSYNGVFHLQRAIIFSQKVLLTPHNMTTVYQNQMSDLTFEVIFKVKWAKNEIFFTIIADFATKLLYFIY